MARSSMERLRKGSCDEPGWVTVNYRTEEDTVADINVERKKGMSWLWWILGLILLALIAWWFLAAGDDDAETATVVDPAPVTAPVTPPEVVGQAGGIAIADILGDPEGNVGQDFSDEVTVADVPTDRGFWIEDQGARLFAIIIDEPTEDPLDINPGQTLRITEGVLRDTTFLSQIPGTPLDADTERLAEQQAVFLTVDEGNIEILPDDSSRTADTTGAGM